MMKLTFRVVLLLAICCLAGIARAEDTILALNVPAKTVPAGGELRVDLVVLNASSVALVQSVPAELRGRLTNGRDTWPITLRGPGDPAAVEPGRFARVSFVGVLPRSAAGRYALELDQPANLRAVVDVGLDDATALASDSGRIDAQSTAAPARPAYEIDRFKYYYREHFSAHEPIYFVYGAKAPAIKFQFSFKYRIFNEDGPLASRFPVLNGLKWTPKVGQRGTVFINQIGTVQHVQKTTPA